MKASIIYGMSGSLKFTYMNNDDQFKSRDKIYSIIKPMISIHEKLGKSRPSPRDLGLYRFAQLSNLVTLTGDLAIERGVADNVFFTNFLDRSNPFELDEMKKWFELEESLIQDSGRVIDRTVLVMKDEEFIEDRILSVPSRAHYFNGVEDYIIKQEIYQGFLNAHYKDLTFINIDNSKEFITKKLGLKYEEKI